MPSKSKRPQRRGAGTLIALRLAPDLIERADRLIETIGKDPTLSTVGEITRSTVLKLAIMEGLAVLEQRYEQGRL